VAVLDVCPRFLLLRLAVLELLLLFLCCPGSLEVCDDFLLSHLVLRAGVRLGLRLLVPGFLLFQNLFLIGGGRAPGLLMVFLIRG